MRIDIYREIKDNGNTKFVKVDDKNKKEAHAKGLLHKSAHLLLVDSNGSICSRLRGLDELRYAGLFTTTVGTHVEKNQTYLKTLKEFIPFLDNLDWVGEFRVRDDFENEICGLYLAKLDKELLPLEFITGRNFLNKVNLENNILNGKTTPHLKMAYNLLRGRNENYE